MRRRVVVLSAAGLASAALSGVSLAYWTSTGGGSASAANTAALSGVTLTSVTLSDAAGSRLLPGGSADVVIKVANTNGFPVAVTAVTQIAGQSVTADNGCTPTGVTFTDQTGSWAVPAGSLGTVIRLAGAAHMDTTSASACQGATFTVPVTISARQ